MASLIKQASRYWIAAFRDASGKQYRRTTRETNKARAQAVAEQYERAAKAKGNSQRVRKVLSQFLRDHYGEELPFATARDFIGQWLAARKSETSPGTFQRYEEVVRKFLSFLGGKTQAPLEEITRAQILAFRDAQIATSAPATVNTALKIIRRIFRSARLDGYLLADPAEGVKTVKNQSALERRPFSVDELKRVLDVAGEEWQSLIKFGLYTGQRLGDLATLSWAQIDLQRDEIALTVRKTGKRLLIPIAAPLREHILGLPAPDDPRAPVHPNASRIVDAQNGRVGTLSNQFSELLVDAGLREARNHKSRGIGRDGKRAGLELSFHSLRHTAVSLLKDAGVPDAVVMALVGHESAAMSARYTHVGKGALARAAKTLPEIGERHQKNDDEE
jgi:integrase